MPVMNWRNFLVIPIVILLAFLAGKSLAVAPFPLIALIACALIGLITFLNPENGLLVIVFSMLLSPQISIADVPGRPVTLRVDDFLVIAVFVAWLARTAVDKDWKGFVKTPLDNTMLFLVFVYVVSTGYGIIFGRINPVKGLFYTLKYLEYFILYWMVVNVVTSRGSVSRYLIAGLITSIIVTVFAYSLFGKAPRVYAPFDGGGTTGAGEPASLGGYYLIIFALLFSFLLHVETLKERVLVLGLILAMLAPFVRTLSRASYLAFIPLLLSMLLLTRRNKLVFGITILVGVMLFPVLSPGLYNDMSRRMMVTFTGYAVGGKANDFTGGSVTNIKDPSAIDRLVSWKTVVRDRLPHNVFTLLFGNGVTGVGFIDGQLFLFLGELGLLGTLAFYWLLLKIIRVAYRIYVSSAGVVVPRSISLGLVCASVALLFQSFTTNSFIIVRIMEPFWFLTALVMITPRIYALPASPALTGARS